MAHITSTTAIEQQPPPSRSPHSPFLDLLPPELRLRIYNHLLVAPTPISGPHARRTTTYSLHTSILRVSRQIHLEARTVFFGKNTFRITSVPSTGEDTDSGAFEPPLQPKDLPLIRHLEIDMLYYPSGPLRTAPGPRLGWTPVCAAAERYVSSVTHLLGFVQPSLLGLRFVADARAYAAVDSTSSSPSEEEEGSDGDGDALDVKKLLTAFHIAEGSPRFNKLLAQMPLVRHVPVSFLFPECYFAGTLAKGDVASKSLFFLACQVVFARSEMRVEALLETLRDDDDDDDEVVVVAEEEGEGDVAEGDVAEGEEVRGGSGRDRGVTDLAPRVVLEWPLGNAVAVAQQAARALERMK
jgi:hypothetical protein